MSDNKTIQDIARRWALAQPSVVAFISLLVPRFHDAQDVLQEVAAVVLSYDFDHKGWPESFDGWILGIARHKALDYHRRTSREKLVFDSEALDRLMDAHVQLGEKFDAHRESLEACLRRIPAKSMKILELRYEKGLNTEEIATALGINNSAVAVTLHRTRAALRDCIENRLAKRTWR